MMIKMNGTTFGLNDFAKRHTADNPYSHFEGTLEDVLRMGAENFDKAKPGYRDGVVNVPVPAEGFLSPVVCMEEGTALMGEFKARREGEAPRVHLRADGKKTPAIAVELDFYRKDVLAEGGDNSTEAEWELIGFRAMAFENEPMTPDTLMHNHFGSDGGTDTQMTTHEFEVALRESFEFWKDKAMVG
jgi:hypothetical protein